MYDQLHATRIIRKKSKVVMFGIAELNACVNNNLNTNKDILWQNE